MSAPQSSPATQPVANHGDGDSGLNSHGDGAQCPVEGALTGESSAPLTTTAELANLLAHGQWADAHGFNADVIDTNAYDGHVALALDTAVLPDIDSALDLLTSSHHLFDVPALDVSSVSDEAPAG